MKPSQASAANEATDGDLLRAGCISLFSKPDSKFRTYRADCSPVSITYVRAQNDLICDLKGSAIGYLISVRYGVIAVFDKRLRWVGTLRRNAEIVSVTLPSRLSGGHARWTGTRLQHFDGDHDYCGFTKAARYANQRGIRNLKSQPSSAPRICSANSFA